MKQNKHRRASDRELLKFTDILTQLEAVEFLGVAHILGVPLTKKCAPSVENREEPRDFWEIFSDALDNFIIAAPRSRRSLLKQMGLTLQQTRKEAEDATTENT